MLYFGCRWLLGSDNRVKDWPLMQTPLPTIVIAFTYIAFCIIAPRILQGRKLLVAKWPVSIHNLVCLGLNCYITYELLSNTVGHYSWYCQPIDVSGNEGPMRIAGGIWWFYFSKFIEMLDSVFFILKGNYNQLSFLHVYHHSSIFIWFWLVTKFIPGGSSVFACSINSTVHIFMYSYYFLSSLGPGVKKYLGWKKYLTMMQISQFCICNYLLIRSSIYGSCGFPMWLLYSNVAYMTSFIVLFGNFYLRNYIKKGQTNQIKVE
jgi:elongation of very long chain fatty acids protein 4